MVRSHSAFAIVSDGFNRTSFHGFLAKRLLLRGCRLLKHIGVAAVVAAPEISGCGFPAQVAVNALVIAVKLSGDIFRVFIRVPTNPLAALGTAPLTKLKQLYWTNATPMEINFASSDHANTALLNLESSVFTGTNGFYQAGVGGGPNGKGDLEASALPSSVMAVAEAKTFASRSAPGTDWISRNFFQS